MKYLFAILAALLIACAPAADTTAPEAPDSEVVPTMDPIPPEPTAEEKMPTESDPSVILDDDDRERFGDVITEEDVICDFEERTLQFSFRNTGDVDWQLNQDVPFPPPKGLASVRITLNNYEVNSRKDMFLDGEQLFGPEELFSDNCGGVEVLSPGEEVTCFIQPVPLATENAFGAPLNDLFINTAGTDGLIQFTC